MENDNIVRLGDTDDEFNEILRKNSEAICSWPSWKLDIWEPISEYINNKRKGEYRIGK